MTVSRRVAFALAAWMFFYPVAAAPGLLDERVTKVGSQPQAASAPTPSLPSEDKGGSSPKAEQPRSRVRLPSALAGYFPNVVLVTQDNKRVRFYDDMLKGKVVLISFMFTTCTTICPVTTSHLASVQEYLGDRLGRDIFILSISVDPANDTPAALKKYAESYKAKPGWYFLTGEKENVQKVRAKLGVYEEDKMQHTGLLIFGNEATGQWRKIPARLKPIDIANAVMGLMERPK